MLEQLLNPQSKVGWIGEEVYTYGSEAEGGDGTESGLKIYESLNPNGRACSLRVVLYDGRRDQNIASCQATWKPDRSRGPMNICNLYVAEGWRRKKLGLSLLIFMVFFVRNKDEDFTFADTLEPDGKEVIKAFWKAAQKVNLNKGFMQQVSLFLSSGKFRKLLDLWSKLGE